MRSFHRSTYLATTVFSLFACLSAAHAQKPNIVLIYADDIGYGDIGCYGATAVRTPNLDKVAAAGLRLTDGHSSAATCTPSRYALMTGQYAWRKQGTGILPGDANLIIPPGTPTLPAMLKGAGYRTGLVGKWHLGLGDSPVDWNKEVKPGPLECGFDAAFFFPATQDRVPTVLMRDHRVVGLDPADPLEVSYKSNFPGEPTGADNPELLKLVHSHGHNQSVHNGIGRIGYQRGGKSARWVDEDLADTFTGEAVKFIEANRAQPFFLFFASHDIHVPRTPNARFAGKSGLGSRGDCLLEFDWTVGKIMETLESLGLAENTLLIISSDNGPVLDDGYQDEAVAKNGGHRPAGPWRGGKVSAFEGGTRVPFLVRWPARVKPAVSDALVCQIDLFASLSSLTGQSLSGEAAPDSFDVLPALLGESRQGREQLVTQGTRDLALRQGNLKYITATKNRKASLFNLAEDPAETKDLIDADPERAATLAQTLETIRTNPRSRP